MHLEAYTTAELLWIGTSIFLMGMSKGGFPVGAIALPVLILVWPDPAKAARSAVAFMLPMLCCMDVVALAFYRRHIRWDRLRRLFPASLAGVVAGSILFVSDDASLLAVSDRALKLLIGMIGLLFVVYQAARRWILAHLDDTSAPGWARSNTFGMAAGVTSTLAHAAGPVLQMYLLPQKLEKLKFAGTTCAYFFLLNLVKMVPFALLGRIQKPNLVLGAYLLPVIPLGVAAGYGVVRVMRGEHYRWFIYGVLFVTSVVLIVKAVGA